jgi:hypothetical protein
MAMNPFKKPCIFCGGLYEEITVERKYGDYQLSSLIFNEKKQQVDANSNLHCLQMFEVRKYSIISKGNARNLTCNKRGKRKCKKCGGFKIMVVCETS